MRKTKRGLWIGIGFLMMGAGAVGVILPILPTVPFLMAALCCFTKGSGKLENWFRQTLILSILVYTFFSRMFDLMLPPVAKHSIVVA